MAKPISQREARALRKRIRILEDQIEMQRNVWTREWPGGVHLASITHRETAIQLQVARKLKHAVVATICGDDIRFYALPAANTASRGRS